MKTKSLEKLACLKDQSKKEEIEKIIRWSSVKGQETWGRDRAALEAGFTAGWHAALAMIALHNLK